MQELTGILRQNHLVIMKVLHEAKDLMVTSDEGYNMLREAIYALARHVEKEDSEFYPLLRETAAGNKRLQNTLDVVEEDMKSVSEHIHCFLDRFPDDCASMDCLQEFGTIFLMLRDRIAKEENVLFPEFEGILLNDAKHLDINLDFHYFIR